MKDFKFKIAGQVHKVSINSVNEDFIDLDLNGENFQIEIEKDKTFVKSPSPSKVVKKEAAPPTVNLKKSGIEEKAPIPGLIIEINYKEGDSVKVGDLLIVMEAMKMEMEIKSAYNGKIKKIHTQKGNNVQAGEVLITIEEI